MIWIFCCSSCWSAARRRPRGITVNEMPTSWFNESDTLQSHGSRLRAEVEGSGFKSRLHSSWVCDFGHGFKSVWHFVKWGCYKRILYKLTWGWNEIMHVVELWKIRCYRVSVTIWWDIWRSGELKKMAEYSMNLFLLPFSYCPIFFPSSEFCPSICTWSYPLPERNTHQMVTQDCGVSTVFTGGLSASWTLEANF